MVGLLGGTYKTGTLSVTNGGTAVVGVGSGWELVQILQGDILLAGGSFTYVESVTDDTHLTLGDPWSGSTLSGANYTILMTSWLRYDPAITQAKVRELIARYTGLGVLIGVDGSVPDPEIGDDGNFALKVNSGIWRIWEKIDGIWVDEGVPAGITWKELWSSTTTYNASDVVARLGQIYVSKVASNLNHPPESSSTQWSLLLQGGTTYEIQMDASDRPESGDTFRRILFGRSVTIPAGMSESIAECTVTATATAVFQLRKSTDQGQSWTQFGSVTFAAGQHTATFTCATDEGFVRGDQMQILAPSPRDATLANILFTIVAYR